MKESNNTFIIDDGVREYVFKNLQGKEFARFYFHPSDTGMAERYEKAIEKFKDMEIVQGDDEEVARQISALDEKIRNLFDEFMGDGAAENIFSVYSPCTVFANGDFYCETVIEKLGEIISDETGKRLKLKTAKIKKATAKNKQYK